MEILPAFDMMLGSLTAADASRRQVNGVLTWRTLAAAAEAGRSAYSKAAGGEEVLSVMKARVRRTPTHVAWMRQCGLMIAVLEGQEHQALAAQVTWTDRARQHEQARDRWLTAAAAATDDAERDACYSAAAREEAERARCAEIVRLAGAWQAAAAEAVSAGLALTAREDAIQRPVAEAVIATGGLAEVARDKHYHTAGR
jgi:hypothetical protein